MTATAVGNTVNYTGTAQTVKATTYDNLTLSGSGIKTITGITVNNKLLMKGTATTTFIATAPVYGASASIEYNGTAIQTTGPELITPFTGTGGIIINNANGVSLGATKTISKLTLTSGQLTLGVNNLTTSSIMDGGSTSYIKTDNTGKVTLNAVTTATIPVGNGSYNPLTITNGGGSDYSVNVSDIASSGGGVQAAKVINRTWNITPSGTPSNVVLGFGYTTGANGGTTFNAATSTAAMDGLHFDGANWVAFSMNVNAAGTSPNSVTFTNTGNNWSTSSFSFGLAGVVLPIELLSINATSQKSQNLVTWATASEKNVAQFDIQRASNPQANWSTIGSVKAIGNSQTEQSYQFVDDAPLSINYYRLRSVDLDGTESLSNVVSVQQSNKGNLKVYPTVANNKLTISSENDDQQIFNIFNLNGKVVQTGQFNGQKELIINELSNGIYIIKVGENSVKFLKN